jgi:hypothetical protein
MRYGNLGDLKHSHNYNRFEERNNSNTGLKTFTECALKLAGVSRSIPYNEAYSSLDQTKVKCNIRSLSVDEKEKVTA